MIMGYDCFYSEYKSKEFKHQTPAEDNKFINFVCYATDLHKTLRLRNERKDFTATLSILSFFAIPLLYSLLVE